MSGAPTTLYRLFDQAGELLYVGITERGAQRWGEHRKSKEWWVEVATTKTTHYETRADALEAERLAIIKERPKFNQAHGSRRRTSPQAKPKARPIVKTGPTAAQIDEFVAAQRAKRVTQGRAPHITDPGVYRLLDAMLSVRLTSTEDA